VQSLEQLRSLLTREAMQCLVISSSKTLKSAYSATLFSHFVSASTWLSPPPTLCHNTTLDSGHYYTFLVVVRPDKTAPSFFNAVILSYRAGKRDKCGLLSPETWKGGRGTIKRQMWSSQTEDAERASKKKTKTKGRRNCGGEFKDRKDRCNSQQTLKEKKTHAPPRVFFSFGRSESLANFKACRH
jgi:hypothetical protein